MAQFAGQRKFNIREWFLFFFGWLVEFSLKLDARHVDAFLMKGSLNEIMNAQYNWNQKLLFDCCFMSHEGHVHSAHIGLVSNFN